MEDFIVKHRDAFPTGVPIVVCCKGIENGSLLTPFEILEEELPGKVQEMFDLLELFPTRCRICFGRLSLGKTW